MAVGSAIKPTYIAENGTATPISHSINSDVPANAKFTDTTYSDATESTHGLMSAEDKAKLDSLDESSWLPKTGGVMTGNIDMLTNKAEIFAPRNDVTSIQVCISSTGTKSLVYCVQNANKITFEKIDGSNFASSDIIEYASPVYILNTPYTS